MLSWLNTVWLFDWLDHWLWNQDWEINMWFQKLQMFLLHSTENNIHALFHIQVFREQKFVNRMNHDNSNVIHYLLLWTKSLHQLTILFRKSKKNTSVKHTPMYPFMWFIWTDLQFPMSSTKGHLEWEHIRWKKSSKSSS